MNPFNHLNVTPSDEKGFTIIEVMIAMGIFAIGILAVAAMQLTAFQGNRSARLQTEAVTLASLQLEQLISNPYANIIDGAAPAQGQGANIDLDWDVTDDSPVVKAKTIIMTASWEDRGGQRNADFQYIISDPD